MGRLAPESLSSETETAEVNQAIDYEQARKESLGEVETYKPVWQEHKAKNERAGGHDAGFANSYRDVSTDMDRLLEQLFMHNVVLGQAEILPIRAQIGSEQPRH